MKDCDLIQSHQGLLVSLNSRPGIIQKFLLLKTDNPVAAAILFPGGPGTMDLQGPPDSPTMRLRQSNFLVRTRNKFRNHGLMTAVFDAPSDRNGPDGMLNGFREGPEHARDIEAVISFLKGNNDLPVWLIGTSRGSASAVNGVLRLQEKTAGLILSSSVSRENPERDNVLSMNLEGITVPVLVVSHEGDACDICPPSDALRIFERLVNAPKRERKMFRGGDPPISDPCGPLSYHGFLGIEEEVVSAIADYIICNSPMGSIGATDK